MKQYNWKCVLFGHKWVTSGFKSLKGTYVPRYKCARCGRIKKVSVDDL